MSRNTCRLCTDADCLGCAGLTRRIHGHHASPHARTYTATLIGKEEGCHLTTVKPELMTPL